jgi:hypothetical protein
MHSKMALGTFSAFVMERPDSYGVSPVVVRTISDPCSGRDQFRTRKEVTKATDAVLQRLRSQLTKEENEVLNTTVLADVANKKTNWKKLRCTSRAFLIDKFRQITGHDPADDVNAGDLSAIIAEDKFGKHYFGRNFNGPAQRAPQPVPETKPAIPDPSYADILISGDELYQRSGVVGHLTTVDCVAA